ncbi:hypothetical protein TREES_T100004985 [Tupaia chinensis]|uniref:Uncharacterized protein n=1 Tax=Tupaia chinensis TaxID=246437 RepID=L9L7G0_TUPCH|nr:hypothetical protein TREES_T100004985 [Tupaia chinensis]
MQTLSEIRTQAGTPNSRGRPQRRATTDEKPEASQGPRQRRSRTSSPVTCEDSDTDLMIVGASEKRRLSSLGLPLAAPGNFRPPPQKAPEYLDVAQKAACAGWLTGGYGDSEPAEGEEGKYPVQPYLGGFLSQLALGEDFRPSRAVGFRLQVCTSKMLTSKA